MYGLHVFYRDYTRADLVKKNWAVSQSEAARLGLQVIGTVGIIQMKRGHSLVLR